MKDDFFPSGLRERKKLAIRKSISTAARDLFTKRGFNEVTVAEISDQANVSVKTLFTYFRSKDDLLFDEETQFCEEILSALRNRQNLESFFESMNSFLWDLIHKINTEAILESFQGFHKCMEFPELNARLTKLWDHYEIELANLIRAELGKDQFDPEPRIVAGQIILIFRMLTSKEWKIQLESIPLSMRQRALEKWLNQSLGLVGDGVRNFGRKAN